MRKYLKLIINFGLTASTALMIWKFLMIITGCEIPIVVVISGSMEPAIYRGDLLFLHRPNNITPGDIVVFQIKSKSIPIVHRVLEIHKTQNNTLSILTKGDNNNIHDRGLYHGLNWIDRKHIMGKVYGYLPKVGYITIWANSFLSYIPRF